jgi:chromosome segregation ATPase
MGGELVVSGNKTTAERLQDCRDELGQANSENERMTVLQSELTSARAELEEARHQLTLDQALPTAERRQLQERIREAEAGRDAWTRRAVAAENDLQQANALLFEIKTLIAGKECILPQIARVLGTQ